ncbi:MAG: hypothetical protein ABSD88_20180 [Candidatus Korobacteraceae bacterium]|jgi:hypothetical protein
MKTISVHGILDKSSESPQREGHKVRVDLDVGEDETIISHTLYSGPRGWPPNGDYKLTFSYRGQRYEANVHFEGKTWQEALFGAV